MYEYEQECFGDCGECRECDQRILEREDYEYECLVDEQLGVL